LLQKDETTTQDPALAGRVQRPSSVGVLYVKFTTDAVTEFLLLSFKEKEDG
jgi:hypothetical protein